MVEELYVVVSIIVPYLQSPDLEGNLKVQPDEPRRVLRYFTEKLVVRCSSNNGRKTKRSVTGTGIVTRS